VKRGTWNKEDGEMEGRCEALDMGLWIWDVRLSEDE